MQFTLVSTIFNEASRLKQTITDLEAQTIKPSEIIITDAGSKDGSIEILEDWKIKSDIKITILIEKDCNVARGRNLAIEKAQTEWIVSTDFGCRFHPNWLQTLLSPLLNPKTYNLDTNNLSTYRSNDLMVIGGAFTIIESDIDTLAGKSDYILQRGYPVVMDEYFSVSSRSIAYKKEVWEQIGGYPEWLTLAADDTIFWKLIKKQAFAYTFVKEPMVYWGRHKTNKAFAKEAFRYGLGDGESGINYRNFWSNLVETGLRYLFFLSLLFWVILSISYILNPNDLLTYLSNDLISSRPTDLWIYWSIGLLTLITSLGLRSYINTYKSWKIVKSNKYNFKAFLNALRQLELSRWQYLNGYIKGLRDKDVKKKEGRDKLWHDLTTESHG